MFLFAVLVCGLSDEFPLGALIKLWLIESLHTLVRSQYLDFVRILLSILRREQILDGLLVVVFFTLELTQSEALGGLLLLELDDFGAASCLGFATRLVRVIIECLHRVSVGLRPRHHPLLLGDLHATHVVILVFISVVGISLIVIGLIYVVRLQWFII